MTLEALADVVCTKVGKTDADSIAACKAYLRQRHEMIYDLALWKDTVGVFTVDVDAEAETVVLPYECARPLALWDEDGGLPLDITSLASVAMTNPAALTDVGGLSKFIEVESVGWPYDLGDGAKLGFINAGNPEIEINISGWGQTAVLPLLDMISSEKLTAAASGTVLSSYWGRIDRMTKPQTASAVVVGQTTPIPEQTWLWPAASTEAVFARVRLVNPPREALTLGVLGKRKLRQMNLDTDPAMIRAVDNALLAFAQADMLERSRQYAKAQAKVQEGTQLANMARDQEVNQSAHEARIIPLVYRDEGEGDVWEEG